MNIPAALKHKPVIVSERYDQVDGRFAGNTEAKALSLGVSQRENEKKPYISAEIWKQEEEASSGQSAELPLHRILDLSILICRSLSHFSEAYRYEHLYDPQNPVMDRIGLQGGAMTVAVCTENEQINEDIRQFNNILGDDGEMIGERLRTLSRTLKDLGY